MEEKGPTIPLQQASLESQRDTPVWLSQKFKRGVAILSAFGIVLLLATVLIVFTGPRASVDNKTERRSNSDHSDEQCGPCSGVRASDNFPLVVDYLVAGGGPGGLQTAADLSSALRATGTLPSAISIAVVEKRKSFGGNLRRVHLKTPKGYDPKSRRSFGPLHGDVGAQRVNVLTLTNERRLFTEYNITMYCTPFRNIINVRGRRQICRDPYTQSTKHAPYYDCAYDSATDSVSCSPDPTDAFAYGDFCTYSSRFSDPDVGAFTTARVKGANFTGCTNYDNTASGVCNNWPNNDPSYDAYQWLLQGNVAPDADRRISGVKPGSGGYDFGTGYPHPLDPARACSADAGAEDPAACPLKRCRKYADWRSFVAGELAPSASSLGKSYNHDYGNFMQGDNVGFYGDYEEGFGACSYSNYQAREWNTASHSCYPRGGMTSLTDAMRARGEANGVQYYLGEPVVCVSKAKGVPGVRYVVRTASKTFHVRKFLFLAVPSVSLQSPAAVGGDVLEALRAKRAFRRARAQRVASVVMQWAPGRRAWFWDYFDLRSGNWSVRTYGDTGCFSRIELIDTPLHRCQNAIRAIYSDSKCRTMWTDLIEAAEASGDWGEVRDRVLVELRDAFPEATVDAPVLTHGEIMDPAWYWAGSRYDDITNEQHAEFAAAPLANERLCLIGEAYHIYYQGWAEGALRSSRECLTKDSKARFGPGVSKQLRALYAARDALVPGTGWYDSKNFQNVPAARGAKHFRNEEWWPYNYSRLLGTNNFCRADLVGHKDYPVVNDEP